jgi:2-polyprenyl-3-methyl-5-hydroxy-6-metoxy-1,4-benzoquinol methylase
MNIEKLNAETWNRLADAYQEKFMDLGLYDSGYDEFCSLLQQDEPRIFEIACGPGNITRNLLSRKPAARIKAIDIAPAMIEKAKANNPQAEFKVMDCRQISRVKEKFDAVICGFVLPYLSREDSAGLFRDCAVLLEPGGIFYLSAVEGTYENSKLMTGGTGDSLFVYFHSREELRNLFAAAGFELLRDERLRYTTDEDSLYHLIFIARKN